MQWGESPTEVYWPRRTFVRLPLLRLGLRPRLKSIHRNRTKNNSSFTVHRIHRLNAAQYFSIMRSIHNVHIGVAMRSLGDASHFGFKLRKLFGLWRCTILEFNRWFKKAGSKIKTPCFITNSIMTWTRPVNYERPKITIWSCYELIFLKCVDITISLLFCNDNWLTGVKKIWNEANSKWKFLPSHLRSIVPTHGVTSYCILPHLLLHAAITVKGRTTQYSSQTKLIKSRWQKTLLTLQCASNSNRKMSSVPLLHYLLLYLTFQRVKRMQTGEKRL